MVEARLLGYLKSTDSKHVLIFRRGDEIILKEKPDSWDNFFEEQSVFGEDYLSERENSHPQERDFE